MPEMVSRKKFEEIMSPRNRDEKTKQRFTRDWAAGRVDIEKSPKRR